MAQGRPAGAERARVTLRRILPWLRWGAVALLLGVLVLDLAFPPPLPGAGAGTASVVTAADGTPLRAFADRQGVWRYPATPDSVSPLYVQALLGYEDRWFHHHPGVNPFALLRAAGQWLRSTPITFWAFAWPLARRMLLHQVVGTLAGVAIMLLLGAPPRVALYIGTLWLALVVVVTAVSLADCYRARSPAVKLVLSTLAVLVTEQRWRGWGIALAMLVTAVHLRGGTRYARA